MSGVNLYTVPYIKVVTTSGIRISVFTKSRSQTTNIQIILTIFDEHIEKHESVSLFLLNEPRKFKCTKDKPTTSSYSLANYGVVL